MITQEMMKYMTDEQIESDLDTTIDILQGRRPMPGYMTTTSALKDEQTLLAEIKRRGLR